MVFWLTLDRNNRYFRFKCHRKTYDEDEVLHTHHIIPRSMFDDTPENLEYCESEDNLIRLSVADHTRAHELLYEVYGREEDRGAVLLLQGYHSEARQIWRRLGAAASHEIQRELGLTMWNNEWQRDMAARSMARPGALESRIRGGRIAGRNRHRGNSTKQTCSVFL